jgi:hypothetical protein
VDEEDRRYFKQQVQSPLCPQLVSRFRPDQPDDNHSPRRRRGAPCAQEIALWRKADKTRTKTGERTRQHKRYEGKRDKEAAEREKAGIKEPKNDDEEHEY